MQQFHTFQDRLGEQKPTHEQHSKPGPRYQIEIKAFADGRDSGIASTVINENVNPNL